MSMLAERRTKVRWILNPRSNQWSDDGTKFGHRLMEKMGWKSGNGLGINQQGSTTNIKVSVRNDNRGIGFKGLPEDVLLHQDNFTDLLQKLASETTEAPPTATETSLEERSRKSKSRVHYHKFTRGKDLSRYSQKDLDCILGKSMPVTAPTDIALSSEKTELESDVVTISRGNMVDYFKSKKPLFGVSVLESKDTPSFGLGFKQTNDDENDEKPSFGFGFSDEARPSIGFGFKQTDGHKKTSLDTDKEITEITSKDNDTVNIPNGKMKKSKKRSAEINSSVEDEKEKKRKSKRMKLEVFVATEESSAVDISTEDQQVKKKKKKKKQKKCEDENVDTDDLCVRGERNEKKKRKKSKITNEEEEIYIERMETELEVKVIDGKETIMKEENIEKKIRKKAKNMSEEVRKEMLTGTDGNNINEEIKGKKQRKKVKNTSEEESESKNEENWIKEKDMVIDGINVEVKKNKKRKKVKNTSEEECKSKNEENGSEEKDMIIDGINVEVKKNKKRKKVKNTSEEECKSKNEDNGSEEKDMIIDGNNINKEVKGKNVENTSEAESLSKNEENGNEEKGPFIHRRKKKKNAFSFQEMNKVLERRKRKLINAKRRRKELSELHRKVDEVAKRRAIEEEANLQEMKEGANLCGMKEELNRLGIEGKANQDGKLVHVVNGKRYVDGIWEHADAEFADRKPEKKTDAEASVPLQYRKDAFDEFLGANTHIIPGYAGLKIKNSTPDFPAKVQL